jgi:hypothetical protein
LQAWDSDDNPSCDFRGDITSTSNASISEVITANYQQVSTSINKYQQVSNLTGNTFKLSPNNNCQYIIVRAY